MAEIINVNEDVCDIIGYPPGVGAYAEMMGRETYRGLPAFARDRVPARDCGVAYKVDEHQGGIDLFNSFRK